MAVAGVPKLKLAGCAAAPGLLKEKSPAGWLPAGAWAALPKLKPPEAAGAEKEKPVVAVVAAVFGVPRVKPPPAAPDPKLNWFMAAALREEGRPPSGDPDPDPGPGPRPGGDGDGGGPAPAAPRLRRTADPPTRSAHRHRRPRPPPAAKRRARAQR